MAAFVAAQYPRHPVNLMSSTTTVTGSSVLKGSGGNAVAAAASDVVALFNSGTCSGRLNSAGNCSTTPAFATAAVLTGSSGNAVLATSANVATLWASGSCSGSFRNDGTCNVGTPTTIATDVLCATTGSTPPVGTCAAHGAQGADTQFATTYTIPANTMVRGMAYRITALMQYTSSASAPTLTLKVRSGSVALFSAVPTPADGLTSQPATITGTYVAGTAVSATAKTFSNDIVTNVTGLSPNTVAQPVAVATNADQTINITANYGAATAENFVFLKGLWITPIPGYAPPQITQHLTDARTLSQTNNTFSFTSPSTAGNSIVCYMGVSGTGNSVVSVNTRGNEAFTQISHVAVGQTQDVWRLTNIAGSGALVEQAKIVWGAASGQGLTMCVEISKGGTLNGTIATNSGTGTAVTTGTSATSVANSLVLVGALSASPYPTSPPPANGSCGGTTTANWTTLVSQRTSTTFGGVLRYANVRATGSYCHSWTWASSVDWDSMVQAFSE